MVDINALIRLLQSGGNIDMRLQFNRDIAEFLVVALKSATLRKEWEQDPNMVKHFDVFDEMKQAEAEFAALWDKSK